MQVGKRGSDILPISHLRLGRQARPGLGTMSDDTAKRKVSELTDIVSCQHYGTAI